MLTLADPFWGHHLVILIDDVVRREAEEKRFREEWQRQVDAMLSLTPNPNPVQTFELGWETAWGPRRRPPERRFDSDSEKTAVNRRPAYDGLKHPPETPQQRADRERKEAAGLEALLFTAELLTGSAVERMLRTAALARVAPNRAALIKELQDAGRKVSPDQILHIEKRADGSIVWLEKGVTDAEAAALGRKGGAGLAHILEKHEADFINRGIPKDQIPAAVMKAVTEGKQIGMQGTRPVFEVEINGVKQYISVNVGNNGFVVGANPTPKDLITKLTGGK